MAGATPSYQDGVVTYEVNVAVSGGQLVEPDSTTGKIKPATANAILCLGVSPTDAIPTATDQNPSGSINLSPKASTCAPWPFGVWRLTAVGAIAFGERVKCAAAGAVAPWVAGTDAPERIVGRCVAAAGIANGAKGDIRLTL